MPDYPATPGKTTVAIDVLLTIARLTTLSVSGVSRMSRIPTSGVRGILKRRQIEDGVRIDIKDDSVYADIYVILQNDVNIRDICRNIQIEVARAISDMIGMQVGHINIHVEDIDYPIETEPDPV
ncbi:MAG: hypothetical protein A2Z45_04515 [Chloroflexi bacterium RBG_19FT_COMBO_55_16]|nr:MAG: hypothetical protein A2Z45_04515 [Chloroflexi bacterium RBG_19FT_COMBO_55_16]